MKPTSRMVEYARNLASTYSEHPRFKMSAILYKKNYLFGIGWNKPHKTHPKSNNPWKTIHAEFDAILGHDKDLLRGSSIYIHRVRRDGKDGLAKPCDYCKHLISMSGIKEVYYSE